VVLRKEVDWGRDGTPPSLPQPGRVGTKKTVGNEDGEGERPGLPPRPARDLLDDDDGEMNGWEALKPT